MSQSLNVLKQPRPFYLIFFIEFWERFGYYGLQALLAVYFVRELGMSYSESFVVFGAFSALVYGLVAIGGWLGDKVLGTKRIMIIGAVVLTVGYILMAMARTDKSMVYMALGSIAVGNGLFKASPSSLLAKCYEEGDRRLDGAFTMYYMAVNIGSFLSMLAVPMIADAYGWSMGFLSSAIGLMVALGNYFLIRHWVADYGSEPDFKPVQPKVLATILAGVVVSCVAGAWILNNLIVANILLSLVGAVVQFVFGKEILASQGAERRKMLVALILMIEAIVFFVMYMQMPTSLNFFAINNIEHEILGMTINPVAFQSLNPFWVMVASPVLAYLYNRSGSTGKGISMPVKFAIGMFATAVSFLILPLAAKFANEQGIISSNWLVLSYFCSSIGELLISGLGLAMVAQLVPERLHGFIMGAWFLTISAASVIAGYAAGMTSVEAGEAATALDTLPIYSQFFEAMGLIAVAVALMMFVTAPWLNRMVESED